MDKYFIRDLFIFLTYAMAIWWGMCLEECENELTLISPTSCEEYIMKESSKVDFTKINVSSYRSEWDDSCKLAKNENCDEPPFSTGCPKGTDTTDCLNSELISCQYANDNVCDEGPENKHCYPGTDFKDCCESIGKRKQITVPGGGWTYAMDAVCDGKAFQLEENRKKTEEGMRRGKHARQEPEFTNLR